MTRISPERKHALQRIIHCLIFRWEPRLNAGSFKSFPAAPVRSDFNRGQSFIGMNNEALSVVAVCICNKDCFPAGINR
jgi:hypothetical protein